MLGGGSNVLVGGRRHPRPGRCGRAAGTSSASDGSRASRCRGHDQRARALADRSRPGRTRGVGRHAGHGRRRHPRQRTLGRTPALGVRRERAPGTRDGRGRDDVAASEMDFGYDRSRLQRTGEVLLSAAFVVQPGDPAAMREEARRVAALSQANAAAGVAERRLHLPEPARRCRACPTGMPRSAGALVDRAGLKGARGGRRRRVAHARQLHREHRRRNCRRHPHADRPLPQRRAPSGSASTWHEEIVYLGAFEPGAGGSRVHSAD